MDKKLPPQNLDAERSVLGGLMLEQSAWDEVVDQISEDDFYKPAHRMIFSAIAELNKKNQPTDLVTISNHLIEKGELETLGGLPYLVEVIEQTPSAANILSYCKIVREKSVLRKVIKMSSGFIEKAFGQDFEEIDGFLDGMESEVFSLVEDREASGLIDASELVRLSLEKLESLYASKLDVTGITSGYPELDDMTAGFQPGEMVIFAARPSMGKTAFSLNIALNAAMRSKKKVAYFSLEMGKEAVMMRLLAGAAKVNMSDLRVGNIADKVWPRLINTAAMVSESGLFIDDSAGISPFEIRAKARRMKARHGLDMIVVDYLQIMSMKQKIESREREVSEISRLLKMIAKELQIPVIALAQLNRGVEGRSDRRPMLSDLRESGSIEQDADVIMMLYREDYYDRDNPDIKGIAEVIIGKQRNGPTGTVKLRWVPEYGLFENLVNGPQAPAPESPLPPPTEQKKYPRKGGGGGQRQPGSPPPNLAPGG